ncbi:hypothetical protein CYLTODRAFT_410426 [Cylindrobasidium torrendii FP15055 ss-10]|uniref:Uncharacterized protein n=1 Tax=Cylindrobasidium torrendii FP15055 ss-10 TaxID=1314674 RepID=A0A0D7BD40_9AGAR|nr:hypothetical protein CYLTODRAFT_410426 [Cylindrobasidium torrendii FP15055 ss-10]
MMVFRSFLCCCNSKPVPAARVEIIDESSRLIPAAEEPIPPTTSFDYGKYEGRLGTIIRAKEGQMMNVNPQDRTRPQSVRNDSSSNFSRDYGEPVDGSSISQAYPEQHTMDIDAFMPPIARGPSRSSSNSYRSTDHTSRPTAIALSARLVSAESLERSGELAKDQPAAHIPDLNIGSLSRSWDD